MVVPFRSPRPDVYGECIFLERWQALMCKEPRDAPHTINELLPDAYPDDTRFGFDEARLLASWFMWLGTHIGTCWRATAERFKGPDRYFIAWSLENRRLQGVNSGRRIIEHLTLDDDGKATIDLSPRHYEVIDAAAMWLGSQDGGDWLKHTCDEIDLIRNMVRDITGLSRPVRSRIVAILNSTLRGS